MKIQSRVPSAEFKGNFEAVFGKAPATKAAKPKEAEGETEARCACSRFPFEHTKRRTCP